MSDPTVPPPEGLPDPAAGGLPPVPPPPPYNPPPAAPPAGPPPPLPPPGAMPPPPAAGGYPAGPTADPAGAPWSIGNAVSYAWAKYQKNWTPFVLALLAYLGVFLVIGIIWIVISSAITSSATKAGSFTVDPTTGQMTYSDASSLGLIGGLLLTAVAVLLFTLLGYLIQANLIRGGLAVVRGQSVEFASFFKFDNFGPIVLASLLVAVLTAVGFFLCYLPGLAVSFFTGYFLFFLIDKNLSPVDSIKASFEFVKGNFGPLLLFWIVCAAITFVGAIVCYVGLLVAVPVVIVAQAFTYLKLNNQEVSPVAA